MDGNNQGRLPEGVTTLKTISSNRQEINDPTKSENKAMFKKKSEFRATMRLTGKKPYLCTPGNVGVVPRTQVETPNGGAHLQGSTPAERCRQRAGKAGVLTTVVTKRDSAKPSSDLPMHGMPVMKRKCE